MSKARATITRSNIFGTDTSPKGEAINYAALDGLDAAQTWLMLNDEAIKEIIEEYKVMMLNAVGEKEYAAFAMEDVPKETASFLQNPLQIGSGAQNECYSLSLRQGKINAGVFPSYLRERYIDIRSTCGWIAATSSP